MYRYIHVQVHTCIHTYIHTYAGAIVTAGANLSELCTQLLNKTRIMNSIVTIIMPLHVQSTLFNISLFNIPGLAVNT